MVLLTLISVIINYEIVITDMPSVLQSYLENYNNEQVENILLSFKLDMLDESFE